MTSYVARSSQYVHRWGERMTHSWHPFGPLPGDSVFFHCKHLVSYTGHNSHQYQANDLALLCALWLGGVREEQVAPRVLVCNIIHFRAACITRGLIVFGSKLHLLCSFLAANYGGINPITSTISKVNQRSLKIRTLASLEPSLSPLRQGQQAQW